MFNLQLWILENREKKCTLTSVMSSSTLQFLSQGKRIRTGTTGSLWAYQHYSSRTTGYGPGEIMCSCLFSQALHNTEPNDLLTICRDSVSMKCCYLEAAKHNLLWAPMCFRSLQNNRYNGTRLCLTHGSKTTSTTKSYQNLRSALKQS